MNLVCFLFALVAAFHGVAVAAITDPVTDFLRRTDKVQYRASVPDWCADDKLYRFDIDLNNDGRKEVLISSSLDRDGKQGFVFYAYERIKTGYRRIGSIHLDLQGFYFGKIDELNAFGIVKFYPGGGGVMGVGAFIFDGTRIQDKPLGSVYFSQKTRSYQGAGIELCAKYSKGSPGAFGERVDIARKKLTPATRARGTFAGHAAVLDAEELRDSYGVKIKAQKFEDALRAEGSRGRRALP